MDRLGNDNLIELIMATDEMWKANKGRAGKKVLMLWCKWGFCFSRGKISVTKQIKEAWAPFSMGVHCVVHWTNL
jgi:hypothetical protein